MTSKIITVIIALVILGAIGYYVATESGSGSSQGIASSSTSTSQQSAYRFNAGMVGTWKSTDDAKFTRTFKTDGTVTDAYDGEPSATETGTFSAIDPSAEAGFPAPAANFAGMEVIKIDFPKSGVMYFAINELTDASLQMTYISGRGNILSFTRVQ